MMVSMGPRRYWEWYKGSLSVVGMDMNEKSEGLRLEALRT
jgi:hypothetical protein